jgi:aldose 1-epimerase
MLQIDADRYTVVDDEFIPTGESRDVTGTRFDFRTERAIGDETIIDHNVCLTDTLQPIRRIGHLRSETSGVTMEMRSTEPGLQVYDGFKLNVGPTGLQGRTYGANAGIALEPQNWPDAVNHSTFPDVVLRPGETYKQHTQFAFSKG